MELNVVVVSSSRELDEVSAGLGGVLVVHLDGEGTHGGLHGDLRRAAVFAGPHGGAPDSSGRGRRERGFESRLVGTGALQ